MITFNELGLAEPILRAVSDEGYDKPTPIQAKAIPALLKGQDIIGIAQTGTGKTASFVLPLLHDIVEQKRKRAPKMCSALILSPTRELASQIVDNINSYAKFTDITVTLVVGGVRPKQQIKALTAGVDIVVATPGRLLDHINAGVVIMTKANSLVIDEADQMLDLGFLPDIRRIVGKLPTKRQTALLSATMPMQIKKLAKDLLNKPVEISVAAVSKPIERIEQSVRHVEKGDKRRVLAEILSQPEVKRTVVFSRTKHGADRISKNLATAKIKAAAIHGNKSQNQRDRVMNEFRTGEIAVLVATDVAARGIDIDGITHVINFDLPNMPESYVHRIGRTARAGKSGVAISFCDTSERGYLKDIEKLIGNRLPVEGEAPAETTGSEQANTPKANNKPAKRNGPSRNRNNKNKSANGGGNKGGEQRKSGPKKSGPGQSNSGRKRWHSNKRKSKAPSAA
ncbi:MAG: DEAD/DEAH box helicase [Hyphomicrobiales bacterium]